MAQTDVPEDSFIGGGEDGGELLDQVRSVACFFQLLDDPDDDFVVDAVRLDPFPALGPGRRWRGVVVRRPSAALRALGEGDILGG